MRFLVSDRDTDAGRRSRAPKLGKLVPERLCIIPVRGAAGRRATRWKARAHLDGNARQDDRIRQDIERRAGTVRRYADRGAPQGLPRNPSRVRPRTTTFHQLGQTDARRAAFSADEPKTGLGTPATRDEHGPDQPQCPAPSSDSSAPPSVPVLSPILLKPDTNGVTLPLEL